ncbi:hypothetical protein PSN45_002311 [Yamadazyma tenuis]|uniref:Cytochrome b5 heme-binding domain-containing protein n=1 Tax=Candida tenuis (strain ATCC 10573 / BCRC 21748 / CBS 615 / JCM 9827 / NBRC 10315 / NRRL Y-1498 / VKM Y-70) TaxID=590646 RepID=G3BEY2_CANTC|nr:uncharacterized protein CANTEDRAFT_111405 [Yamadazyma tenuis ATCC 10573]EGV59963.1 hypothetical protein CANTEDRAFT_111405 [Yamadazyma tenuis ATCC 10573]WEJ94811.1 hypothetical protein PSN45_002311 [Yamadazyma tenuis]
MSRPSYTCEQVKAHCQPKDLWMIVYNKVYDLTNFIELHPGGIEVMIDCGGVDATEAFDDVAHSDYALDMLQPYFVGDLVPWEHRPYKTARAQFQEADKRKEQLKRERATLARQRKKNKLWKRRVERITLVVLSMVAFGTVLFYFLLQRMKLNYYSDI